MNRATVSPSEGDIARTKIEHKKTAHEYDMSHPSVLKYYGTMLPLIAARWELWLYFLVHTGLVVLFRLAKHDKFGLKEIALEPDYEAPWNIIKVPTALLTFFLVFFNGKCYERFCGYYNAHCGIGGRLQQLSGQTLSSWPNNPAERWEAMRYLIASACVVYFKVSDPPGAPRPIEDEEWLRLLSDEGEWLRYGRNICPPLLTKDEVEVLKSYKGNMQMLLQTWGLRELRNGCRTVLGGVEGEIIYVEMEREVFELRSNCAFISNNLAMPIPFPYFHALNTLLMVIDGPACPAAASPQSPPPRCLRLRRAHAAAWPRVSSCPAPRRPLVSCLPCMHVVLACRPLPERTPPERPSAVPPRARAQINYSLYTYAFLYYDSVLTPLMLFLVIVVTLGMREVSSALSNPFGEDEVDFPIHKYIMNIRGLISGLVRDVVLPPKAAAAATAPPPPPPSSIKEPPSSVAPQYAQPYPSMPPPSLLHSLPPSYELLLHQLAQQYAAQYAQQYTAAAAPPPQPAAAQRPPPLPPIGLTARTAPQRVYESSADGAPIQIELPAAHVELPYGGRS